MDIFQRIIIKYRIAMAIMWFIGFLTGLFVGMS